MPLTREGAFLATLSAFALVQFSAGSHDGGNATFQLGFKRLSFNDDAGLARRGPAPGRLSGHIHFRYFGAEVRGLIAYDRRLQAQYRIGPMVVRAPGYTACSTRGRRAAQTPQASIDNLP